MTICDQAGNHIGQGRQFDLEHFTFIVVRCGRCGEFIQTQATVKGEKK